MKTVYLSFTRPNVLRLLAGTKWQTRRLMRKQPLTDRKQVWEYNPAIQAWGTWAQTIRDCGYWRALPPARPGDLLGVLEDYQLGRPRLGKRYIYVWYPSDGNWGYVPVTDAEMERIKARKRPFAVTPGRYMYRSLVRLKFPVVTVTPEWLQDISDEDARAEDCTVEEYAVMWDSINPRPERQWSANPAVWRWEFDVEGERTQCPS